MRKDLRECALCRRRYRVMLKGRKGDKRRKRETEDTAARRHHRDPECQSRVMEAFANDSGWERIGVGAHVATLRAAGFETKQLFTGVGDDPDTGARCLILVTYARAEIVDACRVLTGVRTTKERRATWIRLLSMNPPIRAMCDAARRLGGATAVRAAMQQVGLE